MNVAWTGHRAELFRDPAAAQAAVDDAARDLAGQPELLSFLVGGQRGVDTWAALAAINLGVTFALILPFEVEEFTRDWTVADRALLEQSIAPRAAAVRIAGGYAVRNLQLASGADLLVAVWTRVTGGGTAETIGFAQQAGTPLREIVLEPSAMAQAAQGRGI